MILRPLCGLRTALKELCAGTETITDGNEDALARARKTGSCHFSLCGATLNFFRVR